MMKFWSKLNPEALTELKPDLGLRSWDDLNLEEKQLMYIHLHFQRTRCRTSAIEESILHMYRHYKKKNFTPCYLFAPNLNNAHTDFSNIFLNESKHVVMELLSAYVIYIHKYNGNFNNAADSNYLVENINDVFSQFGVKYHLTEIGFIPRQEEKIIKEIYEPTLKCLADKNWKPVSNDLSDAFADFRKDTEQGYSGCVTKTISAVQAFLQISVHGKTGTGSMSELIREATKKELIPDDAFTQHIFKNMDSVFSRIRQQYGDAHPKGNYADEKTARLILNLSMVFIQHCMQK